MDTLLREAVMTEGRGYSWTDAEVKALLVIWAKDKIQQELEGAKRNKVVFENISRKLLESGIKRDWKQCRAKVKKLKTSYKKAKDKNNVNGGPRATCSFFYALDSILGSRPATHTPVLLESATNQLEEQEEADPPQNIETVQSEDMHDGECESIDDNDDNVSISGPNDLGSTSLVKHKIHTGDTVPIRQSPRRLLLAKKQEMEKAVKSMESQGIIEQSNSPWCSPIVLVIKKDGSTRFCVDYHKLNSVTRKDCYPLPRIDDAIDSLTGSHWFSSLDLKSRYWQVQLAEDAKSKTAFSTGIGLWQFNVMPFGLCNAPATFERLMERVLSGLPTAVALLYLDDILVPGPTFQQHVDNLYHVFIRLRGANLKLNPEKCSLLQKEVKYLGHVVSGSRISPDAEKVQAVVNWPASKSAHQLKSFLDLVSYYRRFIPNFTEVVSPLLKLTQKNVLYFWSTEAEEAFTKLKDLLTFSPILAYPDSSKPFVLDTDASNVDIGAVLSQDDRPVAYFSRVLNKAQKNYCVTRKELLAVVEAIKHFRPYCMARNSRFVLTTLP